MRGCSTVYGTTRAILLSLATAAALLLAAPAQSGHTSAGAKPAVARDSAAGQAAAALPSDEDLLLTGMISLVTIHDIAILAGVLPLPAISYGAEVTEFIANLGLKALPPRLFAPADLSVRSEGAAGPGYTVDGCGIDFQLLAPTGGYSNLYGIANIRDPYTQLSPLRFYPWRNTSDPDDRNAETRWGFLRAPSVYHANTDVKVEIKTPYELRKYDQQSGTFGEPYTPVDTFAEAPQHVYLPIGSHPIQWHGTTQLNALSDVAVPGVMLIFNALTELKNARAAKAAKRAKNTGFTKEIADEAIDAQGAAELTQGVRKFKDVWQKAFEDRQARKAATAAEKLTQKLRAEFRSKIAKTFAKELAQSLLQLARSGVSSIDGSSREQIRRIAGPVLADIVNELWLVYSAQYPGNAFSTDFVISKLDEQSVPVIRRILADLGPDTLLALLNIDLLSTVKIQNVTVYDTRPPIIDLDAQPLVIEASDFGGTRLSRVHNQLLAVAAAHSTDNCGRTPEIFVSGPELLPLGAQQVTITARDRGPNPPNDGQDYAPTAVQNIVVRDTQPPLLLAPPSRVILDSADVGLEQAQIGAAASIDLVDVQPTVGNDAPQVFAVNARTEVHWTATDDSGNSATASQLISVKASNTAPTAHAAAASTLTAQQVDIRLSAADSDELGGRTDPLWFKIESQPQRGEFVAPLYPFFIEDYRTRPNDGLGEDFDPQTDEIFSFIGTHFCATDRPVRRPPRDFVHEARYVHVTDDGVRYVLDEFFVCDQFEDHAATELRFSKWDAAGAFLGQLALGANQEEAPVGDAFRVDRDGFLYYDTDSESGSSSNELFLVRCSLDWPRDADLHSSNRCVQSYKFDSSSTGGGELDARSLAYARIDSSRNVAYVVDGHSLFAFELLESGGVRYLGELGPKDAQDAVLEQWFGRISSLEVGSDGALYANDVDWHRIHKIAPITHSGSEFVLGNYIGWAGKCTGSGNNACEADTANPQLGRSRGYSCTYAANSCTVAANQRAGARQGQFNSPRYVALDPNDVLYVADFENQRVQRLSPDGTFAGEAVSAGSGINRGEHPSFVLGNMGKPASVAVNSTQFFVVDRDEQFVNVFGTLPFKDITDNAATVTYVSDQDFPNPQVAADDTFTFSVTDGLDRSAPATVTVHVSRDFRAPESLSQTVDATEDGSVHFTLTARDPDGIIGKDFLGLDTLTFKLTRWPENGTLSGHGDTWSYRPKADFHGEDSLGFKANDGRDDSNEGTVTFVVAPSNDPPVVTVALPERVARGFPLQLSTTFTDDRVDELAIVDDGDDMTDGYQGIVTWGDGSSDTTGGLANEDGEAKATGLVIAAPPNADSEGRAIAQHSYATTGARTIRVCVTDSGGLQGCGETTVAVQSLVSLGVSGVFYTTPLAQPEDSLQEVPDGTLFTFEITVANGEPDTGAGLPAADVALELKLPAGLDVRAVAAERGRCTRSGLAATCTLGTLEPGAEVKIGIVASGPGSLVYSAARDFEGTLSTTSDALQTEVGLFASIELVAAATDSDGDGMSDAFEHANGLNPQVADGDGDPDGDGLSNVDEFGSGSSPRVADTDGDGASDRAERDAGTNPLVDDIGPQLNVPPDVTVNATGTLTLVQLGTASAADLKDGAISPVPNTRGPFRPGPNVVTWSAVDRSGNRTIGHQFVNVVPMVSFHVSQQAAEGARVRARLQLNGPAVEYPVTVPYRITGDAVSPDDYQLRSAGGGVAVIASGLSADIELDIAKDAHVEPDETIVLTMDAPSHAVPGPTTAHTITVTEQNVPPQVDVSVEQQGRATTSIVSSAGLTAFVSSVRDDPAQHHVFDWSGSDAALLDPLAVHDPGYLFDPAGLSAGLYATHLAVGDDGQPPLSAASSSLLNVAGEPLALRSDEDQDGDGLSDAAEGPADDDGDRVADYLDDIVNPNMLRLAADGSILEVLPGVGVRLGAATFTHSSAYAALKERDLASDAEFGFPSDVPDFEITRLAPAQRAQVVVPLATALSSGAVFRTYSGGQWHDFVTDAGNGVRSARGERGACPPPGSAAYRTGLLAANGCIEISLTDGGPNDSDGVSDGVIRITGGLAAPVSARSTPMQQTRSALTGDGEAVMTRTRLHSDSGDALLKSITVQARGSADERRIDNVVLIHDLNHDGQWDDDDVVLATDRFVDDDGSLTLFPQTPIELPAGDTDLLVVYVFGATG